MTTHLSSQEFVNAIDLVLEPGRQAHLDRCVSCQAQLQELRKVVEDAAGAGAVPAPSPLFWEHFHARVLTAVGTESVRASRQGAWSPARVKVWIAACATMVAVAAGVTLYRGRPTVPMSSGSMTDATGIEGAVAPALDGDEWEFVAGMIGALEDADVHEVLVPIHDALDTAFEGLSDAERDRFVQLLQAELTEGLES